MKGSRIHGVVRELRNENIDVISYTENSGGFLSVGSNIRQPYKKILLIVFPAILLALALIYLFTDRKLTYLEFFCICCILGGGISNISDRIMNNGFVVDFLNFGIGNIRTGILNFADMSVFFGVIFLCIFMFKKHRSACTQGVILFFLKSSYIENFA